LCDGKDVFSVTSFRNHADQETVIIIISVENGTILFQDSLMNGKIF